jgi:signal transduction histidine kinase
VRVSSRPATGGMQAAFTQIARTIVGRSSARDVAQVVVDEVRRLVPSDCCTVWFWQPERGTIQLLATAADQDAVGADALGVPVGGSLPVNDSGVHAVLEHGRSVHEADLRQNPRQTEQQLAATGLRSRLTVPVLVGERPLGVLAVSSRQQGVYTMEHQRLLEHLAVHLAVGLEQARLTDEARRLTDEARAAAVDNARTVERAAERCRRLDAVRAVTAELTREFDLPSLLDLILRHASEIVRCESAIVMLWDEAGQQLVPKAWCGIDHGTTWVASVRLHLGQGAAGQAALERRGIVVEDYPRWPDSILPEQGEDIPLSLMAVPMLYQDRLIGVLTANRMARADGGPVEPFTAQDLELLDVLGTQAAVAIENTRLFEQAATAEALRELARLKAELLNTVSHELRTPLSLIHGYAELLLHRAERLSAAEVAQMSGEIHTSARTLTRLVDDLLDFSQLDRGRLRLRRSTVALQELLEGMVRTFQARPGGERISAALEAGLQVEADPDRLRQVVGNLLTNALEYTAAGPITVRAVQRGEVIQVDVIDEGPGLSAEEVSRVWESFYRGAQAAQLPNRGSGLGLSVVKHLVELHGGRVGVRSTPGDGATFWFTLPAA